MFEKLTEWLKRRHTGAQKKPTPADRGFLVFQHTGEVIRAERCLQAAGFSVEVKGPPPELRSGCDLVVVFPIILESAVCRILEEERLSPISVVPVSDTLLEPVSLYRVKDYGDWFMIQAANVKITVESASGRIVNVSGGGCPDVPYLASLLTGRNIDTAEEPRIHGQTLCSYALQKAFLEARRLWEARHAMADMRHGTG